MYFAFGEGMLDSRYILLEECSPNKKHNKKEDNVLLSLIVQINRKESCLYQNFKEQRIPGFYSF